MIIKSAEFIKSAPALKDCPTPDKPEYAFIGRSNVGKSSLINMLTDHKNLAKTSGTPGKTRHINFFLINESWYLTDLPGFGFARISKSMRESWKKMINHYLNKRDNLLCTFLLIDSRLEPQKIDLEFMEWLGENQIPFVLAFTKTDKLSITKLDSNLSAYKKKLAEQWDPLPRIFISSSEKKEGREEILNFIAETNLLFQAEV